MVAIDVEAISDLKTESYQTVRGGFMANKKRMPYKPLTRPGCCIPDFILYEIAEQARKKKYSDADVEVQGIMSALAIVVAVSIVCLAWQ